MNADNARDLWEFAPARPTTELGLDDQAPIHLLTAYRSA